MPISSSFCYWWHQHNVSRPQKIGSIKALLSNRGKYDEAIKAYDAAIKLDPNYAAAWNDKGIALDESGKYEDATGLQ